VRNEVLHALVAIADTAHVRAGGDRSIRTPGRVRARTRQHGSGSDVRWQVNDLGRPGGRRGSRPGRRGRRCRCRTGCCRAGCWRRRAAHTGARSARQNGRVRGRRGWRLYPGLLTSAAETHQHHTGNGTKDDHEGRDFGRFRTGSYPARHSLQCSPFCRQFAQPTDLTPIEPSRSTILTRF
jgi:hypothetical protein